MKGVMRNPPLPPAHLRHERPEVFTRHDAGVAEVRLQLVRQSSYLLGFVSGPSRICAGQRGPECTCEVRCTASMPHEQSYRVGWDSDDLAKLRLGLTGLHRHVLVPLSGFSARTTTATTTTTVAIRQ